MQKLMGLCCFAVIRFSRLGMAGKVARTNRIDEIMAGFDAGLTAPPNTVRLAGVHNRILSCRISNGRGHLLNS